MAGGDNNPSDSVGLGRNDFRRGRCLDTDVHCVSAGTVQYTADFTSNLLAARSAIPRDNNLTRRHYVRKRRTIPRYNLRIEAPTDNTAHTAYTFFEHS